MQICSRAARRRPRTRPHGRSPRSAPDTHTPLDFALAACKDNLNNGSDGVSVRERLGELLRALETELRAQGRWEKRTPPAEALASTQPFAFDTLNFDQWLQWVLLPRMNELLVLQLPLPAKSSIAAMAEEVYDAADPGAIRIIAIIADIDLLLREDGGQLN